MKLIIGMTGATGAPLGVAWLQRCAICRRWKPIW